MHHVGCDGRTHARWKGRWLLAVVSLSFGVGETARRVRILVMCSCFDKGGQSVPTTPVGIMGTVCFSNKEDKENMGCLPFTRKKRSVDSCSKWDASSPEWKFPRGCTRSISTTFSRKIGSKAIQARKPETSKN